MKRAAFLALLAAFLAGPAPAKSGETIGKFTYQVVGRQADVDSLELGADFLFRYELIREPLTPKWHHLDWCLEASGFQAFRQEVKDIDHMQLEASLFGHYYANDFEVLSVDEQEKHLALFRKTKAAGGPGTTPEEQVRLDDLLAKVGKNRVFIRYDAHWRLETNHDMTAKQQVAGFGFAGEVPAVSKILDAIPKVTRGGIDIPVQDPTFYFGGERVTAITDSLTSYWQLNGELGWATRVIDKLTLGADVQVRCLLGSPDILGDNRVRWFARTSMDFPMTDQSSARLQLLRGQLPPLFTDEAMGSLAFVVHSW
jgi:hypothetical protein